MGYAQRWGWPTAIGLTLLQALQRVVRIRFYSVELAPIVPLRGDLAATIAAIAPEATLRELTEPELARWCRDPAYHLSFDRCMAARARGHRIWGLFIDDTLAYYTFDGTHVSPGEPGLVVRTDPAYLYGYKAYTLPEYRGRRLPLKWWQSTWRDRFAEGFRGYLSYVAFTNPASLRSNRRLGYRRVGIAAIRQTHAGPACFASPGARRYGFRFDRPTADEESLLEDTTIRAGGDLPSQS